MENVQGKYYTVSVKIEVVHENGQVKWIPNELLVSAVSLTDVEVKVAKYFEKNSFNYQITKSGVSKIQDIIE